MSKRTHFIAVGACAIDTILTVPYFPAQDSKLRATSLTKRRGGNCPNSLEVLQQLIQHEAARDDSRRASTPSSTAEEALAMPSLSLMATLPAKDSQSVEYIKSSFDLKPISTKTTAVNGDEGTIITPAPPVDFSHCLHREEHSEPVSSYIISDASTSSRTIVNYNDLQEMSYAEFVTIADSILRGYLDGLSYQTVIEEVQFWFHFEGRISDVTLSSMKHLRSLFDGIKHRRIELKISVELEKPGREGLQELAEQADLVFYSRSWAEHEGHDSAAECLRQQAQRLGAGETDDHERTLICTWGASGACATTVGSSDVLHSPAYKDQNRPIIDTTGAGDTFIAGILFGLLCRDNQPFSRGPELPESLPPRATTDTVHWSLKQRLDFANGLAGRKILLDGFTRLGTAVEGLITRLDNGEGGIRTSLRL